MMMLLVASVVVVVLGAAATALAASPSASDHSAKGDSAKNKDFAGLVDIGGGRKMYMECRGTGYPTVVFVSGGVDRAETWSKTLDKEAKVGLNGGQMVFEEIAAVLAPGHPPKP